MLSDSRPMCSTLCLTAEEEQTATDAKTALEADAEPKPRGLSKKLNSTTDEGQSVICGVVAGLFLTSQTQ